MRRLLPYLVVLLTIPLMACGGAAAPGAGGQPTGAQPTGAQPTSVQSGTPTSGAGATDMPASQAPGPSGGGSATTIIPADCAKGLTEYLVAIEPLVSRFDPAKDTLAALYAADDRTYEKALELLDANAGRATYSCEEVGVTWAMFDAETPWDAVLAIARDAAPGTLGYLDGMRAHAAAHARTLADYGIDGCDAAVKLIKQGVKREKVSGIDKMPFEDAIEFLGKYMAYMHDVQDEVCPRDQLGNDEWGFMSPAR